MKTLTKSDAENRVENRDQDSDMVRNIRVVNNKLQVKYKDGWVVESHLKDIPDTNFNFVYDSVESDYKVLKNAVSDVYNDNIGMWNVEFDTFPNGNIKSLYVPFYTDLVDDKVIYNLYSKNSVEDYELKQKVENMPIPSHKLETKELFVDSLNDGTVRTDVEVKYRSKIKEAFKNVETQVDTDIIKHREYVGTKDNSIYTNTLKSIYTIPLAIIILFYICFSYSIIWTEDVHYRHKYRKKSNKIKRYIKKLGKSSILGYLSLIYIIVHIFRVMREAYNMDDIKEVESQELIDL